VPLIPDSAAFEKSFATLPTASFQAGETVFLAGSRTGRLLILKKGAVVVIKDGVEIAKGVRTGRRVWRTLDSLGSPPHRGCACLAIFRVLSRQRVASCTRPTRMHLHR
jgi:hypothetical protein